MEKTYNYSRDVACVAPPEDSINLCAKSYRVTAFHIGTLRENAHVQKEFFYVVPLHQIFVRQRLNFPYGNNMGDLNWYEYNTPGKDQSIWCHPYQTKELLPERSKVLDEPREVLLEVFKVFGRTKASVDKIL